MEKLYNNIHWDVSALSPDHGSTLTERLPVPYLERPPAVINVDVGRQLFVDDFLIENSSMTRTFHQPATRPMPVFFPETETERNDGYCPMAAPFDDGLFFDEKAGVFKLWYHAGWFRGIGYAESEDGINWKRLNELQPEHKNELVLPLVDGVFRDGAAIWLDRETNREDERYKMFVFFREYAQKKQNYAELTYEEARYAQRERGVLYKSADGIVWHEVCDTSPCGDNSTFFYNPFRKKWVFSLRTFSTIDGSRTRGYFEADDFFSAHWSKENIVFWSRTDSDDMPDPELGYPPQLYKLDAVAYESLMLGMFAIFEGPPNEVCKTLGRPKTIDLQLAFSRDGFHWDRSNRIPFLRASRIPGKWDCGYLHSCGGICCVVGDALYFYYTAWSGQSPRTGMDMYAGASMGLAVLRRDGFASLDTDEIGGELLTRVFEGSGRWLFVNADATDGCLQAEITDETGVTLSGYEAENCKPVMRNGTCLAVVWKENNALPKQLSRFRVRFRTRNTQLYAFWLSETPEGHSCGYMAAGGRGFPDAKDVSFPKKWT